MILFAQTLGWIFRPPSRGKRDFKTDGRGWGSVLSSGRHHGCLYRNGISPSEFYGI